MTRRSRGREIALQVLYLLEQNPQVDPAEVDRFLQQRIRELQIRDFARLLIEGVGSNRAEIDQMISSVAENWRLDRMAAIDRNILRLGVFEMRFCPDVPDKVAINEALELAKRYSTAQSSRFVNGILDRLQAADSAPEDASSEAVSDSYPPDERPTDSTPESPADTRPEQDEPLPPDPSAN